MSTTSSAVADLQSQWHTLPDLDRAKAVLAIKQSGISTRQIAQHLDCSDSLLRQGKISTNELVRRSKAAGIRRTAMHRETREFERTQASRRACKKICDWLAAEQMSGPYGEQIVNGARHLFAKAEQDGKFPKDAAPTDMPTAEIIKRCRPAELKTDAISFVARHAWWLARWAYYAFTDTSVRDTALDLALDEQFRR